MVTTEGPEKERTSGGEADPDDGQELVVPSSSFDAPPDPQAEARGLDSSRDKPYDPLRAHDETAAALAKLLVMMFFGTLLILVVGTVVVALLKPAELQHMVAFFGAIVSAIGTLLGGVIGYYFGRSTA